MTILVVAALTACLLFGKNTGQTTSDPHGSLLVSQAIIEHGTIQLDRYQSHFGNYTFQIKEKGGHFYYYFPLGTPLVAVPFVAVAKLLGADMAVAEHESMTQLVIAAVVLMLSFLVMQRIARLYLNPLDSAFLSAAFLFGSAFTSTGMTALWSHDFAALFALLAISLLLQAKVTGRPVHWRLLAVCLFMAYLCRPPLVLLAPIVVAIQFIFVDRKSALKVLFALLLLATAFMAFSWHQFHQVLPEYYLPQRLVGAHFWQALYGNLASPARGLFVYSPFLLLPVLAVARLWKQHPAYRAEVSLALWPAVHLLAISKLPLWWAGYSYGARLMYDALPGLFVLLVIFWRSIDKRSIAARFTIVATAFAVVVNLGQGIFNPNAVIWNGTPSVNQHPELLFNWKYPPFLHSAGKHQQRIAEIQALETTNLNAAKSSLHGYRETLGGPETIMASLSDHRVLIGEQYGFASDVLMFLKWYLPEKTLRWNDGYYSEIAFVPDASALSATALRMALQSIALQEIRVLINDTNIGAVVVPAGRVSVNIDIQGALRPDQVNVLQLELPGARRASAKDARMVSIALKSLTFVGE